MYTKINKVDSELPQIQCKKCGYYGIVKGEKINKCSPGGQKPVNAKLINSNKIIIEKPEEVPKIALIRENKCIGCTKCLRVCPVDAIIGTKKNMHTVIELLCTGCELCVTACPVNCIDMIINPQWIKSNNIYKKTIINTRYNNSISIYNQKQSIKNIKIYKKNNNNFNINKIEHINRCYHQVRIAIIAVQKSIINAERYLSIYKKHEILKKEAKIKLQHAYSNEKKALKILHNMIPYINNL
ncbi:Electron transport complex protein rnfB [Candidatus Johnevansia muelleri]|uniref:Electron transport complex protein rnfB n=1 Tax=Candidatus Johnevansia muelleri TaxID=1495769 RepID=A0A078KEP5_9GAMM|nr:Electron transport complex protein rnfB [Candidatus Evansia muelleri]